MSVERSTFKRRPLICSGCAARTAPLLWSYDPIPPCAVCGAPQQSADGPAPEKAHAVIGDEIDRTIEHGLCYKDGTPRRFTSRQELKRAEAQSGYRILEKGERFRGDERHGRRH